MLTAQEWSTLCLHETCTEEQDNPCTPGDVQAFPPSYADMVVIEVRTALQRLSPCERQAVSLCFGIDCYAEGSYREIGRVMGKSKRLVRRLVTSALRKLSHEPNLQMLACNVPATSDWYGDEESYGVA